VPKTPTRIALSDDEFPDTSNADVPSVSVGPIFGRDWRILQDANIYAVIDVENNPAGIAVVIANAIHPDERADFTKLLKSQRHMDVDKLFALFNKIVEVASGNPTNSSSASSPGTAKKAAVRRSVAG
jgi:hypothetical protein